MLYFLLSRLERLGIEIFVYYWIQEGINGGISPNLDNLIGGCSFELLGAKDMKEIGRIPGREKYSEEKLLDRLKKGNICMGAKYQNEIAAFTWCDFTGDSITEQKIILRPYEAYLFDMYTMKPFRGYNIAPYLRYQFYKLLKQMGRNTCYSISEFFNTPSIKFKKKLNARFLELRLEIKLFNKLHWNLKINGETHDQKELINAIPRN